LQAGRLTKEYPDKTAKSASDFLKYVIDEIKKIDPAYDPNLLGLCASGKVEYTHCGLTPHQKLLKIKKWKNLIENSNCAIVGKI
jgi:hypothetical protein